MPGIDEYKKVLDELANKASEEFINNSSIDHAATMIEILFRHAKGKIRILTDHLTSTVYDRPELKEAARQFMEKEDSEICIIMQLHADTTAEERAESAFIAFLKEYKEKVKFYKTVNSSKLDKLKWHFLVTRTDKDKIALRVEIDTVKRYATGSFNANDPGQALCDFFDKELGGDGVEALAV